MRIARVKLLMLLVRVIPPRTSWILWILKLTLLYVSYPTMSYICIYSDKLPQNGTHFFFILTTRYFRQQPVYCGIELISFFFFNFRSILKCLSNIGRIVWILRSPCLKALFAQQRFVPMKCARRWENGCIVYVNTILDK